MKYIKYYFFLISINIFCQTDCIHNVNTNPNLPHSNNSLPKFTNGTDDERYYNNFDWFKVDPNTGEYMDNGCVNMFFGPDAIPEMGNILNSTMPYYDYLSPTYKAVDGTATAIQPLHNNGWELMMVNLGQYPAGDDPAAQNATLLPISNGDLPSLPYIVIYNRYTGVLRVFVNWGLDKDINTFADAMKITLKFTDETDNFSGLMRLGNGLDKPLDQTSDILTMTSIAKAPQQGKEWASTDFQLTYDPCTCFYPSNLQLLFQQVKTSTITLVGRSVTLEDQVLINNENMTVNLTDFLSNFEYQSEGEEIDKNGLVMEQSLVQMINNYTEKYKAYNKALVETGEHNKKVKTNSTVFEWQFRDKGKTWVLNYLQDCLECDGTMLDDLDYLAYDLSGKYDVVTHKKKEMLFRSSATNKYSGQVVEIKIVKE